MSKEPLDTLLDTVALAKVLLMLAFIDKKNREENIKELRETVKKGRTLMTKFGEKLLPFNVRVELRAAELGVEKLTAAFPAVAEPRQCHPGLTCVRWPECENCGPPRI